MKVSVQSFGGFAMTVLRALVFSILVCGALSLVRAAGDWGPARAGVSADAGRQAVPYPGCVKIFNGENFECWEADPSTWSIVDGAMRGVGGSSRLAFTKSTHPAHCAIDYAPRSEE